MNDRSQIRTLKAALQKKYNEATTDENRRKIKFVAKCIKALMDE